MKKMDAVLAVVVAVLVTAGYQWYQHPDWWKPSPQSHKTQHRFQRFSTPQEKPLSAQHGRSPAQRDAVSVATSTPQVEVPAGMFLAHVIDDTTRKPITAFKYRRTIEQATPVEHPPFSDWRELASPEGMYLFDEGPKYVPSQDIMENNRRLRIARADEIDLDADSYEFELVNVRKLLQSKGEGPGGARVVSLHALDRDQRIVVTVRDTFSKQPIREFAYLIVKGTVSPDDMKKDIGWTFHRNEEGVLEVSRQDKYLNTAAIRAEGYEPVQIGIDPRDGDRRYRTIDYGDLRRLKFTAQLIPLNLPEGYLRVVVRDRQGGDAVDYYSFALVFRHPSAEDWDILEWRPGLGEVPYIHDIIPSPDTSRPTILAVRADGHRDYSVDLKELYRSAPDANGNFVIYLEPAPVSDRVAQALSPVKDTLDQLRSRSSRTSERQTDTRTCGVKGRITVNGEPPMDGSAQVMVIASGIAAPAQVGADGYYAIDTLPAGLAQVNVGLRTADGSKRTRSNDITLVDRQTVECNIDFPATGTVTGTLTGLRDDESGGVFLIKGDLALANVTEDDLYDFGEIADAEARIDKDRRFIIKEVDAGHYTVVALSEHFGGTAEERNFWFVTGTVDVEAGGVAEVSLSLE